MMRGALVGLGVLWLGLSCTEKGRPVVLVHVVGTANLSAHSARVIVTQGTSMTRLGEAHGEGTVEWRLGVYLDKSVSGSVSVVACAYTSMVAPSATNYTLRVSRSRHWGRPCRDACACRYRAATDKW